MLCALLFAPWVYPRETLSGLMGRWAATERGVRGAVGRTGARLIDWLHWWEPHHCHVTFLLENEYRRAAY